VNTFGIQPLYAGQQLGRVVLACLQTYLRGVEFELGPGNGAKILKSFQLYYCQHHTQPMQQVPGHLDEFSPPWAPARLALCKQTLEMHNMLQLTQHPLGAVTESKHTNDPMLSKTPWVECWITTGMVQHHGIVAHGHKSRVCAT
jgi:hypothetical protein